MADLRPEFVEDVEMRNDKKWCEKCLIWKRPDMDHCSYCNVCVEGFDHHCAVLGICIGDKNMKYFLQFLAWIGINAMIKFGAYVVFFMSIHENVDKTKYFVPVFVCSIVCWFIFFLFTGLSYYFFQ